MSDKEKSTHGVKVSKADNPQVTVNVDSAEELVKVNGTLAGAAIGTAAGGAVVAAGVSAVQAAAVATAAAAAHNAAAVGTLGLFGAFKAGALTGVVANPATWALLATNPVGATVLIAGGGAVGAFAGYKLFKKALGK